MMIECVLVEKRMDIFMSSINKKIDLDAYDYLIEKLKREIAKKNQIIRCYSEWKEKGEKGYSVSKHLRDQGIMSVGIYGLGAIGKSLVQELLADGYNVSFISDKYLRKEWYGYKIKGILEEWPKVDAVIYTQVAESQEIYDELAHKYSGILLSIDDVILGKNE